MIERELNPPDYQDSIPVHLPAAFLEFTFWQYSMTEIEGDVVSFRSPKVAGYGDKKIYGEWQIDLTKNKKTLVSPMSFDELRNIPGAEFFVISESGAVITEWSQDYENNRRRALSSGFHCGVRLAS